MPETGLTSRERYLTTIEGGEPDHPPVWMIQQVSHYLQPYQDLAAQWPDRKAFSLDPEAAAKTAELAMQHFRPDLLTVLEDPHHFLIELGFEVEFEGGPLRNSTPVRTDEDLAHLGELDAGNTRAVQALKMLRGGAGEDSALLSCCPAPFSLCVHAIEGKPSPSLHVTKEMSFSDPKQLCRILDRMTGLLAQYAAAQVTEGGADGIFIAEPWGGFLALPQDYEEFAAAYQQRLIQSLRTACPGVPIHLHVLGSAPVLDTMGASGADVLTVDRTTPLALARKRFPSAVLEGNLDYVALHVPGGVERAVRRMVEGFDGSRRWIACTGDRLRPRAQLEAVKQFVEIVSNWKW